MFAWSELENIYLHDSDKF